MAKIAWPALEAQKILKAHKDLEKEILFETGFGPSGLPHIGTFAEVVRTLIVMQAVKDQQPDAKCRLIVFSDDMDGLRNLPENVPNHDLLRPHLGAPLSAIPDPFGETDSFSGYMNRQLRHFLDSFGFDYEYQSSTDCYKGGVFDEGLKQVMRNYDEVRNLFIKTISESKRESWSPFFPICEKCGKIYSTRVTSIDRENFTINYTCDQDGEHFNSCGHQGTVPVTGGHVKVGWKVDWALRWYVFSVDYEMHGKDLMESASLSSKICRALGKKAPTLYKYELFLDENGAKISKKIGNGISMDQWVKFAPLGALLHFLLGNPNKAKKMGLPILPRLIDEYLQTSRSEISNEAQCSSWYTRHLRKLPMLEEPEVHSEVSFALLYNVAESLGIHDHEMLFNYALQYDARVEKDREFFHEICTKVTRLAEFMAESAEPFEFTPNPEFIPLLKEISDHLHSLTELDGSAFQSKIFAITKEREINQREFFGFLYGALLGKAQGPKLGPFFGILGLEESKKMFATAVEKYC